MRKLLCFSVVSLWEVGVVEPVYFHVVLLTVLSAGGALSCTVGVLVSAEGHFLHCCHFSFFNVCPCYFCNLAHSGGRDVVRNS